MIGEIVGSFTLVARHLHLMDPTEPGSVRNVQAEPGLWLVKLYEGAALEAVRDRWEGLLTLRTLPARRIATQSGRLLFYDARKRKKSEEAPKASADDGVEHCDWGISVDCHVGPDSLRILVGRPFKKVGRLVVVLNDAAWKGLNEEGKE